MRSQKRLHVMLLLRANRDLQCYTHKKKLPPDIPNAFALSNTFRLASHPTSRHTQNMLRFWNAMTVVGSGGPLPPLPLEEVIRGATGDVWLSSTWGWVELQAARWRARKGTRVSAQPSKQYRACFSTTAPYTVEKDPDAMLFEEGDT